MRDATNTILCWNLYSGEIALVPWRDRDGLSRSYERSALACYAEVRGISVEQRQTHVLSEALGLIVRDHCNPKSVHDTLLGLVEYRDSVSESEDLLGPSATL
ncbi:hypothetical protein WJ41_13945 [Burkholderia ubonensis]|uniref:hypothetical protein n=1 Tax=Burkholderia ubonensis TaxID=101571 RepID=UPI00075DD391|nr:hypothetical protein [Burkholderia ubonensis]KVH72228.1 hypothetical protein WJ41_13945 [Burkholderia ubonensis]KVU04745.1 hypothetical protein WK61_02500 [Burkholderia ubonensis]